MSSRHLIFLLINSVRKGKAMSTVKASESCQPNEPNSPKNSCKQQRNPKGFRLPFFKSKPKHGKQSESIAEEMAGPGGRRRTSSVGEQEIEAVRKNSKALTVRRNHGIEPETQSAPVN